MRDLFFEELIRSYVEENRRFLRRSWLAEQVDEKLSQPESRFVLLTAKPGLGKTVFMAQLARDHPGWLRYFIRRDQRAVLADVSDKSLLLRIGYQLAARQPQLFGEEQLRISVIQDVGKNKEGTRVVAATVQRLTVSPFYKAVVEIEQRVKENHGEVIGLEVQDFVADVRLLSTEDLVYLALIQPALALQRSDPTQQIVILIDALDEIEPHRTPHNILTWLTNLQADLPANIRFVLTSREIEGPLNTFRAKQAPRVIPVPIVETNPLVKADVETYVGRLVGELVFESLLKSVEGGAAAFTTRVVEKTGGNLGYLDALARSIDQASEEASAPDEATAARGRRTLAALVNVSELPPDLQGLYAFFLGRIKDDVANERVEVTDPATGEIYDKPVWPTIYARLLGALAVAMEALDFDLLMQLSEVRAERTWVNHALGRLQPFLDTSAGRYRFYHATVAEFLTADNGSELHVDAGQWHRRIADRYWRLRNDWSQVDRYGLEFLSAHLREADDAERLYALLTPAWSHEKRDRFGSASSFSTDIHLALDCAYEHGDLPAIFKIGLLFGDIAIDVPVPALETLALLGDAQGTADYLALMPSASERLAALKTILPLMRKRVGLSEVQRLFKDQVLSLSGSGQNLITEEIFALVGIDEIGRAHELAESTSGAVNFASAWLDVARAKIASELDPRIPDELETELDKRIALVENEYEKAGALAKVVELMLETGNLDKADAWAGKALTIALAASWSDEAARVLSAVVRLLDLEERPALAATGELALRLARNLGSNGIRILRQKEIVPWLLRSGRDADAFDLAEHVRDPRIWRRDLIFHDEEGNRAREYTGEIISAIARARFSELKDAPGTIAWMLEQLAPRPVLREWADESRIRATLGMDDSDGAAPSRGAVELLREMDDSFSRPTSMSGFDANEQAFGMFLAAAVSLVNSDRPEEATEVTLGVLAKIREPDARSGVSRAHYCQPENVAFELISHHQPRCALQVARAIATSPFLDPAWRAATIARNLAQEAYFEEARELVDELLSAVRSEDEETIAARRGLVHRLAEGFAALGAVERCLRAAAVLPRDPGRFALLIDFAETFVARNRADDARKIMDFAMESFRSSFSKQVPADDPVAVTFGGPDELGWRDWQDNDCADWLEALDRARLVLIGLGADTRAIHVVKWMDECVGWLSAEGYRTWAQIKLAKALVWAGQTERAVWLSTQTDWEDLEAKTQILRTVVVALLLGGKEAESERVLKTIAGETAQAEARLLGAADLIAARHDPGFTIAWARQGFLAVADKGDVKSGAAPKALQTLVSALAEQGLTTRADEISTWISDPGFQAEAWVSISEKLQKRGEDSDAGQFARRALEAATNIDARQERVAVLKRIAEVCILLAKVSQSVALLRRTVGIIESIEVADEKAAMLAEFVGARLMNEYPPLPDVKTLSPYLGLEWTCAFAKEISYNVVSVQAGLPMIIGVVRCLTIYARYFESEANLAEMSTNGLGIVFSTLEGLDDNYLEQMIGSARALAGMSAMPDIDVSADRFVRIAIGIKSRSQRASALTTLMTAFAEIGFAAKSLEVAARALPLVTDVETSSSFVSHAVEAANNLLPSGHTSDAVRLMAFALEAAKWDKKALLEAASSICPALVQLNREGDLWSLFAAVEPLPGSSSPRAA